MLHEACENNSFSKAHVFRQQKTFKNGKKEVDDEQCSGRPSCPRTSDNMAKIKSFDGQMSA